MSAEFTQVPRSSGVCGHNLLLATVEFAVRDWYILGAPQAEEFGLAQTIEDEHESRPATASTGVLAETGVPEARPAGHVAHQAPLRPQLTAAPAAAAAESASLDAHDVAGEASAQHGEPDYNEHSNREDSSPEELAAAVAASQQWPRVIRSALML